MWEPFEQQLAKYQELEQQLADPAVVSDRARYSRVAKEHGALTKKVKPYVEYKKLSEDLAGIEAAMKDEKDEEMRRYLEDEHRTLAERKLALQDKLEELLLVDPSEDFGSVIMEIRAGTGGDEAAIFAGDLYGMFTH